MNRDSKKLIISVLCTTIWLYFIPCVSAETVHFKSGLKIEGDIIERVDDYIKMDFQGTPLSYYLDDIERIEDNKNKAFTLLDGNTFILSAIIPSEEMNRSITYYYLNSNNKGIIISLIKFYLTNPNGILNDNTRWYPSMHFFATVLRDNKDLIGELKLSNTQLKGRAKEELSRLIYLAENLQPVERVRDYWDLDFLWMEFFATGNDSPVKKVIDVLEYMNYDPSLFLEDKEIVFTYGKTAFWSLTSNMVQHERVFEIVQKELGERTGLCKVRLTIAIGSYYDELAQYDKALTYFEKALAEHKKTAEICDVYYYVASVYLKEKDKDNALKQYNYLKLYNGNLAKKLLQEIERKQGQVLNLENRRKRK